MQSPGIYTIGTFDLAALGASVTPFAALPIITGLAGIDALNLEANFSYGSGGASAILRVQTSFDAGVSWRDVARMDFATAARVAWANLSGLTAKGVAAYAALGAEGVTDGLLGDRLQATLLITGAYVNSTLVVRGHAR